LVARMVWVGGTETAEGVGSGQWHAGGGRQAARTGPVVHRGLVSRVHEGGWHIWMWAGMAGTVGGRTVWVGGTEMAENVPIGKWVGSTQLQPLSVGRCHPNHSLCTHHHAPTVCHPTYREVTRRGRCGARATGNRQGRRQQGWHDGEATRRGRHEARATSNWQGQRWRGWHDSEATG